MNSHRLKKLLGQAAAEALSPQEERELSTLLANASDWDVAQQDLNAFRRRVADLQSFQAALRAGEPVLPPAQLLRLQEMIQRHHPEPSRRAKIIPFPRWIIGAAIAATIAVLLLVRPRELQPPGVFEFAVIGTATTTRSASPDETPSLGADWRISSHPNLASLSAWVGAELPPKVRARFWVDEEAGVIRAMVRRKDGSLLRSTHPIDRGARLTDQLQAIALGMER